MHRRGARVIGLARECDRQPGLAYDAGHSGDFKILGFENGPLLDVDLDEAQYVIKTLTGCWNLTRIEAVGANGFGQRDAIRIFQCQECRIETACDRSAADEGNAEPYAFFLRKRNYVDRQRKSHLSCYISAFERQRHAENPVERTGIGDCVDMRAQ